MPVTQDSRVSVQDLVYDLPLDTFAFSVNNSHLRDPLLQTRLEIVRHEVLGFARVKHVQVEGSVNGEFSHILQVFIIVFVHRDSPVSVLHNSSL